MTRKQVMVIDDDSVMLLLMKNQLEALYDVVTFCRVPKRLRN